MKVGEFVENYRGGTIQRMKSGRFTFYTWTLYRDTKPGEARQQISYTSQDLVQLKKLADYAIDQISEGRN